MVDPSMYVTKPRADWSGLLRSFVETVADMFALEAFGDMRVEVFVEILFICASKRQICWQRARQGELRRAKYKAANVCCVVCLCQDV